MAAITRTCASLGVFGDDLDPVQVTACLGADPTEALRRGEARNGSAGRTYPAKTGSWHYSAGARSPGDIDAQIVEILSALTDDLSAWKDLVVRYRCRLFCGLFLHETNQMAGIGPSTLRMIGERGLELVLDVYGLGDGPRLSEDDAMP